MFLWILPWIRRYIKLVLPVFFPNFFQNLQTFSLNFIKFTLYTFCKIFYLVWWNKGYLSEEAKFLEQNPSTPLMLGPQIEIKVLFCFSQISIHKSKYSKQHNCRITNFFAQQAHSHSMCMCQIRQIFLNTFTHHTSRTWTTHCVNQLYKVSLVGWLSSSHAGCFPNLKSCVWIPVKT